MKVLKKAVAFTRLNFSLSTFFMIVKTKIFLLIQLLSLIGLLDL